MAKSIIVYGVPGGKTRFAQRIADYFGLRSFVQNFSGFPVCPKPTLYITDATSIPKNYEQMSRSFQEVADEINASIPLTDWQSGPPPMVGEWNASFGTNLPNRRRWWDGESWSHVWIDGVTSQELSNKGAAIRIEDAEGMVWRGLSQEPIKVTE